MPDHATSSSPAVQAQLDRLFAHGPGTDTLGLDRITRLLARLGDPHLALPPVLHVAGTNGKGSTCAFLRAALEASGHRVHVYTSPHLVRFNERIRLAGRLIDDTLLAPLLEEVLDASEDLNASFFEVTTAATFLAFARHPADACVVEVGLGGRLDATNVLPAPAACGIAALGIDHQAFLGDTLEEIAGEKAGIAKPGVPLVTMRYPPPVAARVADVATAAGAKLLVEGDAWRYRMKGDRLHIEDDGGTVDLPLPSLVGAHQAANLALATVMLRRSGLAVPDDALATAARDTRWPGRMQRLRPGPLTALLPGGAALWIDGGHNADAAAALARALAEQANGATVTLVIGMLANKDAAAMIAALAPHVARIVAVPTPGHAHHATDVLAQLARNAGLSAETAPDLPTALSRGHFSKRSVPSTNANLFLIAGSLYLAGEALRLNDELPD